MAQKRATRTAIKRDPKTGRYMPAKAAKRRKATEVVQGFKQQGIAKKSSWCPDCGNIHGGER